VFLSFVCFWLRHCIHFLSGTSWELLRTELLREPNWTVFILARTRTETELPSVSPINAGVLHVGEHSVVYCCVWRRKGHVTPPYCCMIQCLPCNLAMHDAEQSEGNEGEPRRGSAPLLLHSRVLPGFYGFNSYRMGGMPQYCYNLWPKQNKREQTLNEFNKLRPTIKFTVGKKLHNPINFLGLIIQCEDEKLLFWINRKPSQTDIIIPRNSYHKHVHKFSSINYLLNTTYNYPVTKKATETELNTIRGIQLNSPYNVNQINKLPVTPKKN
jgi:hypothetical protein